jgi:ADP-glucose pyrophosphorylase
MLADIPVIILAGGQSSRLRLVLPDGMPKILADINGRPFLDILDIQLIDAGLETLIYATGYGHNKIVQYFNSRSTRYQTRQISYEAQPTGTAGAIKAAIRMYPKQLNRSLYYGASPYYFIVNGDTICDIDYDTMLAAHIHRKAIVTIGIDHLTGVFVGTFIASHEFLDYIPDGFVNLETVIEQLLAKYPEALALHRIYKSFLDIGTVDGLSRLRAER